MTLGNENFDKWIQQFVCEIWLSATESFLTETIRKSIWENQLSGITFPRQRIPENQSSGTSSPDKMTACLEKLLRRNEFPLIGDILHGKVAFFSLLFSSQLSIRKNSIKRRRYEVLRSHCCAVDVKNIRATTCATVFFSKFLITEL